MSRYDEPTPHDTRSQEWRGMSERDLLLEIREQQERMTERLAQGDTKLALFESRIKLLERINYGVITLFLSADVIAVLGLVVHHA
jgi:hypothetical protein